MSVWVVADSGILLSSVLPEPLSSTAKALLRLWLREGIEIAAPTLFRYELVAVIRKNVARGIISASEAVISRDFVLEYSVQLFMDDDLLRRGYELAARFNRPTAYDTQYLAVAERLNCEFWTADERLYNAVHNDLNWVKWLGNFSASQ
jgi:predicted nucleic acid-binding protein